MSIVHVMDHPLIQHKLSLMRDQETGPKEFRELLNEISMLMAYEVTRDLPLKTIEIETPICRAQTQVIAGKKLAIVPILRAGLGMVDGIMSLVPAAKVGHIGLYRDPNTLEPVEYYCKLPADAQEREILLVDPMLATGGSASAAIGFLKKRGCKNIKLVNLIAAPEGVARVQADHPKCRYLPVGILVALMLMCQFFPFHAKLMGKTDIGAGLVKIHREVSMRYSWDRGLTGEEDAFVKKAVELIGEGALVINVPSDGSCWSYGVEGINTYFRRSSDNGRGGAEESKILRTQLRDISTSEEVQRLVNDLDARYVLMLDVQGSDHRTTTTIRYKEENWRGIETIDEQTPGFKLLLSEDDMRLYEIVG